MSPVNTLIIVINVLVFAGLSFLGDTTDVRFMYNHGASFWPAFFVHLYFKIEIRKEELPKRVGTVIDNLFVKRVMVTLKEAKKLNLKANETNMYGLVIYPK